MLEMTTKWSQLNKETQLRLPWNMIQTESHSFCVFYLNMHAFIEDENRGLWDVVEILSGFMILSRFWFFPLTWNGVVSLTHPTLS